jgi:predicted RND superfamily exporter protein
MDAHERAVAWTVSLVTTRPGTVVLAFLLATAVFVPGLGNVSTEAGTDQFTQSSPSQAALEDVNREFTPVFEEGDASTQLIQSGENVLSKPGVLRMLRAQHRVADRPGLRVADTSSAARIVARQVDPTATTLDAQVRAVEQATAGQIDAAVDRAAASPGFRSLLSTDFNRRSASASATIGVVSHNVPGGSGAMAGTSGDSPLQSIQIETTRVVASAGGDIRVFGSGILSEEFSAVIFDSLVIVVPAAALLILFFLVFAYRDPVDLVLGVVSLLLAVVWTFGFMGLVGIPFTQMLIAVPPLILAVGIDFGIHAVNRYREEQADGGPGVGAAMRAAASQLLVAFFIVTGTTVIGFTANTTSDLGPIREFGVVAAVGIVFTFFLFGVFLPAAKVYTDRLRERAGIPIFGSPLGAEGSLLGAVLPAGIGIARRVPYVFLLVLVVGTAGAAVYGAGVDTTFSQEDFLPPEDSPDYLDELPEPFAPGEYTVTRDLNFLEANFESAQGDTVTVYVQGPMTRDYALESVRRAARDPPDALVRDEGYAETSSVIDVVDSYAAADREFAALVARNDRDGDGVPDDNLPDVYDELLDSRYEDRALRYLQEDRRGTRVVYETRSDATQGEVVADARTVADRHRFAATATGQVVVFKTVSDTIFESAVTSLTAALALTAVFLVFIYRLLDGRWTLGLVNLVPILVTVSLLAATMRYFGVPFNALTATVLSIAIGLGIDYSAHVVHRFADEYEDGDDDLFVALDRAVRGTGGALAGSMLTTTTGIGVLVLAITPILGQFGLITALSILYSFVTAVVATPSVLVVWDDLRAG